MRQSRLRSWATCSAAHTKGDMLECGMSDNVSSYRLQHSIRPLYLLVTAQNCQALAAMTFCGAMHGDAQHCWSQQCTAYEVQVRRHSVLSQPMGFCMQQLAAISLCDFQLRGPAAGDFIDRPRMQCRNQHLPLPCGTLHHFLDDNPSRHISMRAAVTGYQQQSSCRTSGTCS